MLGFWIFMFIMSLLIPVTMVAVGSRYVNNPPEEINSLFGYRTAMSMQNMDTWRFAHNLIGRIWRAAGLFILAADVPVMLVYRSADIAAVGTAGGIVTFAQIALMIVTIIPVEIALQRNFTKEGLRKV